MTRAFNIVSMDSSDVLDFLKLHLGTLFLDTYSLPSFENILDIVCSNLSIENHSEIYSTAACALNDFLCHLFDREADLLSFSTNDFLGKFSEHHYDSSVFPFDLKRSGQIFFEKFFDLYYTPATKIEIDMMLEWCLFVVQFSEANVERTKDALSLLKRLKECCVESTICKFEKPVVLNPIDAVESKENEKRLSSDYVKRDLVATSQGFSDVTVDYDTKHCSCYTYKVSGDCACIDEDVFMSSASDECRD